MVSPMLNFKLSIQMVYITSNIWFEYLKAIATSSLICFYPSCIHNTTHIFHIGTCGGLVFYLIHFGYPPMYWDIGPLCIYMWSCFILLYMHRSIMYLLSFPWSLVIYFMGLHFSWLGGHHFTHPIKSISTSIGDLYFNQFIFATIILVFCLLKSFWTHLTTSS